MKPLSVIKFASEIVVSVGVGALVGNTIKMTTPANIHIAKKVAIGIGGFVISSMITDLATKYTTNTIDETVEKITKIKQVVTEQKQIFEQEQK